MDAHHKQLQCVVVTPERAVLDESVEFVALPMYDGELGVLPGRAPLIGRLGYGELRLQRAGRTERYFVDGGFAQVRADVVTVLTQRAIAAAELNPQQSQQRLATAMGTPATSPEEQAAREHAGQRARAEIRVAQRAQVGG